MDSPQILATSIKHAFILDNVIKHTSDALVLGLPKNNGDSAIRKKFNDLVLNMTNQLVFGVVASIPREFGFSLEKEGTGFKFSYVDKAGVYKQSVSFDKDYRIIGNPIVDIVTVADINTMKLIDALQQHQIHTFAGHAVDNDTKQIIHDKNTVKPTKTVSEEKFIYRARLKGSTKFISPGYKSKSTWQRASAVIAAVEEEAKRMHRKLSDYEICLLPISAPITESADAFAAKYKTKLKEKADKAKAKILKEKELALQKEIDKHLAYVAELQKKQSSLRNTI